MRLQKRTNSLTGWLSERDASEQGFTIIETMIALIIAMISVLGTVSLFTYAINYNSGASGRAMALTIAQQRMEQLRSLQFTDSALKATQKPSKETAVTGADQRFTVETHICDGTNHSAPFCTAGSCNASATMKVISVQVTPQSSSAEWAKDAVMVKTYRAANTMGSF